MDFQQMDKQKFQLNIVLMRKDVEMKFWGCPKMNYRDASIRGIYYIPKSKTNCDV